MDAIEAITTRKAQRAFAPDPVEPEKLKQIVDAGRHAMSARNLQPWQFVVINNRDRLHEISALCVGTCWVGNFDGQKIAQMLSVPAQWAIFTILAFGYPNSANPPQSRPLKPRHAIVHYEHWGNHQPG